MDKNTFLKTYLVNRRNTNCLKWDALDVRFGDPNLTAMWVADMEFKTCEKIIEALQNRVAHGVYGYTVIPNSYYQAVIDWHKKRHGYTLQKEWFRFSYGVVTSIYWLVNAFTQPQDSILILTPVYYPFHNAIKDNNRKLVRSELIRDQNGRYHIDFEDVEKQIIENQVKLFIQCSPHNPAGRIWTKTELHRLLEICEKHNVLVISDEIHQDIVLGDTPFTPALQVENGRFKNNLIILSSASKSFNLACLLSSHVFIPNKDLRNTYDTYVKTVNQIEPNVLGLTATEAAYTYGEEWLEGLLDVIKSNFSTFSTILKSAAPKLVITPLEGTYLCWVDLRAYIEPKNTKSFIQDTCGVAIDFGEWFSDKCQGFVRFNLATDPSIVEAVAHKIANALQEV